MFDLTAFQRDILYIVAGDDRPNGAAILAQLESYYDESISSARLYPNLEILIEKGLLTKGQKTGRENYYTLTDRGHRELCARQEWEQQYVTQTGIY